MRTLIVEDEVQLAKMLADHLSKHGFVSDHVVTFADADAALASFVYNLVILDRRLPDGDGIDLIKSCRKAAPRAAVIVLTARDATYDRVTGLDLGADDYVAKPFDMDEVTARIRAVVRRSGTAPAPMISCGRLTFDPATRNFEIQGAPLLLPRRELALLETLIMRVRRVVRRDTLLREMFGIDDDVQSNTVESHVSRLRTRLAEKRAGVSIQPVRGVGYILDSLP